ncbi:unnamed protein product [Acanthosepion pharaonis]|uniref:EF-hand domain-containing protein n=1 Tax=Acanthosepion pharaonis TaxID=158019 RepID=A0A812DVR6_ACAPH|nr:unnamed protein product [Sepia pharaonis]
MSAYIGKLRNITKEICKQIYAKDKKQLTTLKSKVQIKRQEQDSKNKARENEMTERFNALKEQFSEWLLPLQNKLELNSVKGALKTFVEFSEDVPEEIYESSELDLCLEKLDDSHKILNCNEFSELILNYTVNMDKPTFNLFLSHLNRCAGAYQYSVNSEQRRTVLINLFVACDQSQLGVLDRHRVLGLLEEFWEDTTEEMRAILNHPKRYVLSFFFSKVFFLSVSFSFHFFSLSLSFHFFCLPFSSQPFPLASLFPTFSLGLSLFSHALSVFSLSLFLCFFFCLHFFHLSLLCLLDGLTLHFFFFLLSLFLPHLLFCTPCILLFLLCLTIFYFSSPTHIFPSPLCYPPLTYFPSSVCQKVHLLFPFFAHLVFVPHLCLLALVLSLISTSFFFLSFFLHSAWVDFISLLLCLFFLLAFLFIILLFYFSLVFALFHLFLSFYFHQSHYCSLFFITCCLSIKFTSIFHVVAANTVIPPFFLVSGAYPHIMTFR